MSKDLAPIRGCFAAVVISVVFAVAVVLLITHWSALRMIIGIAEQHF